MYPDPLSLSRVPVEPAQSPQAASRTASEIAFATIYAEQMQATQEIAQLSSSDSSTSADSSIASPMDGLLALLQQQTGLPSSAFGTGNLSLSSAANSSIGQIQSRNPGKLHSAEPSENSSAIMSDSSSQTQEKAPSGLHRLISWLDAHAHLHSTHHCAASVRQAMEAAGIPTAGRPDDAGDYGPFLVRHGALPVDSESYQPQPGDIAVFDKSSDHPAGHIQVFNGQHWVSDFVQQGFSPYRDQESTPPATVYRLS